MKRDKELISISDDDTRAVVKNKNNTANILFISILPLLSILSIFITGFISNMDLLLLIKISILIFLLTTALMFYMRMQINISDIKFSKSIILIFNIIPIILIMLKESPDIYSFWMIGGLIIAMLIDSKLGLLVYFNHTFLLGITLEPRPEAIIHILIMGILFSLLSSSLRNKSTVVYSSIILLSSNITLAFLMNNFLIEENTNSNYLASLFSILAVLVTAFLLSLIYDKINSRHSPTTEHAINHSDIRVLDSDNRGSILLDNDDLMENASVLSDRNIRTSYELLLSEDNELFLRIKEYSTALYKHSILIGDLSGRAAKVIGANEALARAGGYYHELGKIISKNYIDEGLKLADDYGFPEELKLILKQHSIRHDKPTSIESSIVMLSDNVASTIEYIVKSEKGKYTSDKIIDNIFRMRMDKGTFDDSGLSVKDFRLLKEFYQDEYRKSKANS